jgi:hypothetical protein
MPRNRLKKLNSKQSVNTFTPPDPSLEKTDGGASNAWKNPVETFQSLECRNAERFSFI